MSSAPRRRRVSAAFAGAVVAIAATAGSAQAAVPVSGGTLDWGVKQSFRNYVENGPAMGEISVADGATRSPDGTFRWPVSGGEYDAAAGTGEVRTTGTVRFYGHGGQLEVVVSNPRLELAAQTGTLFADVKSRSMSDGALKDYPNTDLVTLDLAAATATQTDAGVRVEAVPTTLTANGSPAFAGFYQPGTAFDPLTLDAIYGEVVAPKIKVPAKAQKIDSDRRAKVAKITCATGPCSVSAPKRTKLKVAGESFRAKLVTPRALDAGSRGNVEVKVSKQAAKALGEAEGTVKVKVSVEAAGDVTKERAKVTLKA